MYRDRLRAGSFRGVPFRTPNSEREGGHRGTVHEYPNSDDYTTQNLGKAPTRFVVTAVVYGQDYDLVRDQLIAALEQGGPGRLVHRYFGEFDAELEPGQRYKLVETEEQGGKAVFTIPFIRAGKSKAPSVNANGEQLVTATAQVAREYARAKFEGDVDQHGPEWLRDKMLDAVNTVNSALRDLNRRAQGALAYASGVQAAINNFGNAAATLIASPTLVFDIADQIIAIHAEAFEAVATIAQAQRDTVDAFATPSLETAQAQEAARKVARTLRGMVTDLIAIVTPDSDDTTELTAQSSLNERAVPEVTKVTGVISAAETALSLTFDSRRTAEEVRDTLAAALQTLAEQIDASTLEGDNLFASIIDLRVAVISHLTAVSGALPQPAQYVPPSTMPALLVAHIVHGDARRVDEIVTRNNLRYPGFAPAGVPLEVVEQ